MRNIADINYGLEIVIEKTEIVHEMIYTFISGNLSKNRQRWESGIIYVECSQVIVIQFCLFS